MKVVTIADLVDYEDMHDYQDAVVVRVLKQDVIRTLDNFMGETGSQRLLSAMLLLLQYYMPEEDYKDWYKTIQHQL